MDGYSLLLVAFIAEVIGTIAGFGSSTIFIPLALLLLDFNTALVLAAFLHIFGNLWRMVFFRKGIDFSLGIRFGIPSIIFSLLGASLVILMPSAALKMLLGLFLVLYSAYSLGFKNMVLKPGSLTVAVGGALSGFLAGIIGTGGALRGAFLNSFNLEKSSYVATAAFVAVLVDMTRIPVYVANGFLDEKFYVYVPLLLLAAFAGSYVGKAIVSRIDQHKFRVVVFVAIALAGLKFVLDYFVLG